MKIKNIIIILTSSFLVTATAQSRVIYDHDETIVQAPIKDSNEESLMGIVCRTRNHLRWDYCSNRDEENNELMKSFKFTNYGGNPSVPNSGFTVGRDFEFMFEDLARSDLGLLIWDSPDETESHGHLKLMNFFPREVLPAIRYESDSDKDIVIVTLPTREEVTFNGKTKEILGGALKEGPMKVDSSGAAMTPDIRYVGNGVVIETSALADWPVGLAMANAGKKAVIKKKGFKNCSVPVRDLWYTDRNKGGNVFFNKQYVTDIAFDSFLKKQCKFSMY